MPHTLVLPGLYDSGPEHWQSHWERDDPDGVRRVVQRDWATPRLADWVATLDDAIAALDPADAPVVLAAHSSSCALVARWAPAASPAHLARVKGALLVAPSDPEAPSYPDGPTGFAPMPREPLPFPSIVVASADDEYVSLDRAREFADAWRSRFVDAGPLGHINGASGLGAWPLGRTLLAELRVWPAYALRLRAVVDRAERRLLEIDDAANARRPAPGKWSPREVMGHLVDSATNNHGRFVRAALGGGLVFQGYAQDGWVELQRWHDASWRELVTLWAALNRQLARLMALVPDDVRTRAHERHNLHEVAWSTHAPTSPASLDWFMADYVGHLEHHLRQVLGESW